MTYRVATYMNEESWAASGPDWLNQVDQAGLTGFIFGKLPAEAQTQLKAGITFIPARIWDLQPLADVLEKGERCLLTDPSVFPKGDYPEEFDAFCGQLAVQN